MKVITRIEDNVIVAISETAIKVSNGYNLGSYILAETIGKKEFIVYDIGVVPKEVKAQEYTYNGIEFTTNPNYTEPFNEKREIEELKQENQGLKQQLDNTRLEMQQAIAELSMLIVTPSE